MIETTRIRWTGPLGYNPVAGRRVVPGEEYDVPADTARFLIAEGKATAARVKTMEQKDGAGPDVKSKGRKPVGEED